MAQFEVSGPASATREDGAGEETATLARLAVIDCFNQTIVLKTSTRAAYVETC